MNQVPASESRAWAWSVLDPKPLTSNLETLLGGSRVVLSRAISPLIWVITIVVLLIVPLMTTHETPSRPLSPSTFKTLHYKDAAFFRTARQRSAGQMAWGRPNTCHDEALGV